MALNEPRHTSSDLVSWNASIRGKDVRVTIDRNTIEDWLVLETSTPEEQLRNVTQNISMLNRCAAGRLRSDPDATSILLKIEDLTASSSLEETDEGDEPEQEPSLRSKARTRARAQESHSTDPRNSWTQNLGPGDEVAQVLSVAQVDRLW
jgi:hypothetical protein